MNPYCNFKNTNYCHTHGYHIKDDHTSQICTWPCFYHNPNATKFNNGWKQRGTTQNNYAITVWP